MADSSQFPPDLANMGELEAALKGLSAELAQSAREADAAASRVERRTDQAKARREADTRARRQVVTEEAAVTTDAETVAQRRAPVEERIAAARERAVRAAQEENRLLPVLARGQALPLGEGAYGGVRATPAQGIQAYGQQIQALARQQEAGGTPPPPPPPPVAAAAGEPPDRNLRNVIDGYRRQAEETRGLSADDQDLLARARALAAQEGQLEGAFQRTTRAVGLSSDAYTRHGYLTSEFINAAARGEVTIRELGNQVLGTVAKFSAWSAAATAVFGAVAALHALGQGAIDSASGVGLVSRVIPQAREQSDALQRSFRDLSHEFNLPIADVTDAVYGMGKVFQTLPEALSASRQALFAVKVGELDAATATRYLTAIVNGFGLQAAELPAIFDAINQAQNRFGGNTGQLIAGVAKAGGAFKLAGGDFRELIALVETGVKLTGTSGENVGTAIGRSASVVLTAAGQARLKAAGLDPTLEYPKLLAQAFEQAKGQSRTRVEELARALVPSGGQFARVFVPLLENAQLYNKVLGDIAPEKAKGSAQRELARALGQPNEQLKALGNNLQQLGSALSSVGGLTPLGGLVHGLNVSLHLVTELLDEFDKLTGGIPVIGPLVQQAFLPLLEVGGALALARRFDVGGRLGGAGGQILGASPATLERRQILKGLQDEEQFLAQMRQQTARSAGLAAYQAQSAGARFAAAEVNPALTDEQRVQAAREFQSRAEAAALLEQEQADIAARIAVIQEQRTTFQAAQLGSLEAVRAQALSQGIYYTRGLAQPSPTQPFPVGGTSPGGVVLPGGGAAARAAESATAVTSAAQEEASRVQQLQTRLAATGVAGAALSRGLGLGAAGLRTAGSVFTAVGVGVRGIGVAMLAALGPLDLILAGLIGIPLLAEQIKSRRDSFEKAAKGLDQLNSASPADLRAQAEKALKKADDPGNNPISWVADLVDQTNNEPLQRSAQQLLQRANALERAQSHGRLLPIAEIQSQLQGSLSRAQGQTQRFAAVNKALDELDKGYAFNLGGPVAKQAALSYRQQLEAKIADLAASGRNVDAALRSIGDLQGQQTFALGTENRIAIQGLTPGNSRALRQQVAVLYELIGKSTNQKDIQGYLQLIDQLDQSFLSEARKNLDTLTAEHASPGAIASATADLKGKARQLFRGSLEADIRRLRATLKAEKDTIGYIQAQTEDLLRQQLQQLAGNVFATPLGAGGPLGGPSDALKQKIEDSRGRLRQVRSQQDDNQKALKTLLDALGERDKAYKQFADGLNTAQSQTSDALAKFQSEQQLAAAQFALGHGQEAQLQFAVTQAQQLASKVQSLGKAAGPNAYTDALTAIAQARKALQDFEHQQAQDLVQAQGELAKSRTEDPVKQARIDEQTARRVLALAQTPVEKLTDQAGLNNARRTYREAQYQGAYDEIQFQADIGKITKDVEIKRLEALLKRVKGDKQLRETIRRQLYQLKHEADDTSLDLDVGNIRLPSIYEIRRAAKAAISGVSVTQSFATTINVARPQDAPLVGATMDRYHRGTGKAIERATGRR